MRPSFLERRTAAACVAPLLAATVSCATRPQSDHGTPLIISPRTGRILEGTFPSAALGVRKHYAIYLPPSYAPDGARRYPVLYYLHGLSGSETDWLSRGGIDAVADSMIAAGRPEALIVMPDGDDGWYNSWTLETPRSACADTVRTESAERFCVEHQRYDDYVARDLVRYIDATYRTRADRAHRGIAGLSMGGYGAVLLALRYPDVFAAAASHSGVLSMTFVGPHPFTAPPRYAESTDTLRALGGYWPRYLALFGTDIATWRDRDPARAAESLVRRGAPVPALHIDCGTDDPFIDQNRALHWELSRLGVAHEYREWPGGHSWRYWSRHVGESMAWLEGIVAR